MEARKGLLASQTPLLGKVLCLAVAISHFEPIALGISVIVMGLA